MSARPSFRPELSDAELDVLRRTAAGETKAEIADATSHSPETIKTQLRWCRIRLGARNTKHAIAIASEKGLLP